jgi:hypothetical protein
MHSSDADEQTILSMLDRLNTLVFERDRAVVDELWSDLGFRLLGSEPGDRTETRAELAAQFEKIFSRPFRLSWAWKDRTVTRHGDLAWACAETNLEIAHPDHTELRPYRMVCIFQKVGERWRWRLFSGSEPAG